MLTSILLATLGGAIIGIAASWLLYSKGRVAGISGILGGLLGPLDDQTAWRGSFLGGLWTGGVLLLWVWPESVVAPIDRSLPLLALAGVLVGYGTRLGSGCTSGHGVCGLTRFSPRSLVATITFMATGIITATVLGLSGGGS